VIIASISRRHRRDATANEVLSMLLLAHRRLVGLSRETAGGRESAVMMIERRNGGYLRPMSDEAATSARRVDGPSEIVVDLPNTSDAPAIARTHVKTHAAHLPPDLIQAAVLLVSELVTNAVLHGRPDIVLRVRADPRGITVSVQDTGSGRPEMRASDPAHHEARGRGLRIVDAMAARWGVEPSEPIPGKVVWFELRS
jgi:anti-sigma regulatory factor (Ser/Thr protein kinase)